MGSDDPKHTFSSYIDPEGTTIPPKVRGAGARTFLVCETVRRRPLGYGGDETSVRSGYLSLL